MGLVVWHQYDVLLATRPYGWDAMVKYVAYLAQADIKKVETLTTSDLAGGTDTELIDDYRRSKGDLKDLLSEERGTLGIGGYSDTLKGPLKWCGTTRRVCCGFSCSPTTRHLSEDTLRPSLEHPSAQNLLEQREINAAV